MAADVTGDGKVMAMVRVVVKGMVRVSVKVMVVVRVRSGFSGYKTMEILHAWRPT